MKQNIGGEDADGMPLSRCGLFFGLGLNVLVGQSFVNVLQLLRTL
jgi:hypothetical protein